MNIPALSESCPLCAGQTARLETTLEGPFRLWRCQSCRFMWIDRGDLAQSSVKAVYDDYAYNHNLAEKFERTRGSYLRGLEDRVLRNTLPSQRGAFLDVGCANGEYLWAAKEMGFRRVAGVEIDRVAAARARAYGDVVSSLDDLPSEAFEVVQVKNVISNIPDAARFVGSAVRVLRPGGLLLLDVLNERGLTARLRKSLPSPIRMYGIFRPPYVINGFSTYPLKYLITKLDLRLARLFTAGPGSVHIPYCKGGLRSVAGGCATLLGMGSMLLSECRKQ
jgi:SAM-dependent methyltransferase